MWDDLIHRTMFLAASDSSQTIQDPWQPASQPTTFTTFVMRMFILSDDEINHQLRDLGLIPWWSYEKVKIASFRPLAALTHWWDFVLWGDDAIPMHAVNIVLYGIMCVLAAMFYRRMLAPAWVAGLAAILFAVDDAHIIPVAWISNRNGLLALIFGLLTLIAHDRWRREQWKAGAVLAPFFLTLSVASGELGMATGAYLVAHAIFLDGAVARQRLLALLPYTVVGIVWVLLYNVLDYGAFGSGLYVDPAREPLRALMLLIDQGPTLLVAQLAAIDPLPYFLVSKPARSIYWLGAMFVIVLISITLWSVIGKNRLAGFWSAGSLMSLVLVSGINVTTGRVLLFVGFGCMGLVAQFVARVVEDTEAAFLQRAKRTIALLICIHFIILHALFSPLHFAFRTVSSPRPLLNLEPALNFGALEGVQNQDLIIVNAPHTFAFLYASSLRMLHGQAWSPRVRLLSPGSTSVTITRLDSTTIFVEPSGGYLVPPGSTIGDSASALPDVHPAYYYQHFDETFRSKGHPMNIHERVEVTGMTAEVIALTNDGRPSSARIRFTVPLESHSLRWMMWDWGQKAFVGFTLPEVGGSLHVPGPPATLTTDLYPFGGL